MITANRILTEMKVEQRNSAHQEKWDKLFVDYFGHDAALDRNFFANSTVVLCPEYNQQMKRLCSVLNKACEAIVLNYFKDSRIRNYYQLDNEMESLLRKAEKKEYNQGFYRPDFLYDVHNQAKICEIGARYPLNGWMISYYLRAMDLKLGEVNSEDSNLKNLIDDIYTELAPFKKITLVHDDEKGTEIFYLKEELEQRSLEFRSVKPQDLTLSDDGYLILEMDRAELKKIRPEVIDKIIENNSYFNDIRTLILIHDKRILSVIYDEKIMDNYLSNDDHNFLKDYLIPSFVITHPDQCDAFINSEQNLILKVNSGGRGIGAYIKNDCTPKQWKEIIQNNWNNYLIQHYVDQKEFYDVENNRQIHLVGMLLCKNSQSYGSGLFRGSDETVVNVHQGRALIYPIL